MSNVTLVEMYPQNKKSNTSVRPYFDPLVDNMGLQNYSLSLFDGAFHEEPIICLEINGIKRHITGLNEFAPEVQELSADEQTAKIKQIRTVVSELEKIMAANVIEPADPDFWNKVKVLKPDNGDFWDKIKMRCGNEPVYLEPNKDPYDLIKLYALEAGGFSMIAKSLEEARSMASPPKFYLDKQNETAATKTEVKKLRNLALTELDKMFRKSQNKLFYVAKIVDPNSMQYRKTTPIDIIYDNCDKFINGELVDKDKRKTAERFLEACALDMETLKIRALVKDATFYKFIAVKGDGFIYHLNSSTMMGRTFPDAMQFLKNPLHEDVLKDLLDNVEKYWNS